MEHVCRNQICISGSFNESNFLPKWKLSYFFILQVAASSDFMLAYVDFFLGGDEKRPDLPPRLHHHFPMSLIFGGDGSYMAPFSLHNDNIITSLISQVCQTFKAVIDLFFFHMIYSWAKF